MAIMPNKPALLFLTGLLMAAGCELKPPSSVAPGGISSNQSQGVASTVATVPQCVYLSGGQGAFTLAAFKGQVVLLDFCAPWSPASKAMIPELNRLDEEHRAAGLKIVGMVVDAPAEAGIPPDVQELGAVYPLVAVPRSHLVQFGNVRSIPSRLLVDRKGQVRQLYPGQVSPEQLRADLEVLLHE